MIRLKRLKDVGPGTELRRWFNHDPVTWSRFRERDFRELDSHPQARDPIVTAAGQRIVTLVCSSQDEEHNNAVALKAYLEAKLNGRHGGTWHRPSKITR